MSRSTFEALQLNRDLDRSATKETLAWQEHQGKFFTNCFDLNRS